MEDNEQELFQSIISLCKCGDLKKLKTVIENQDELDLRDVDFEEQTPLHAAVANGHLEITKWLLQQGLDPEEHNGNGMNALHICGSGQAAIARVLLESGAVFHLTDCLLALLRHHRIPTRK